MRISGESAIQIIASLIGSGLVVTALTWLVSDVNKPNIYLNVQPQLSTNLKNTDNTQASPVSYYEITARNDGRSSATNVTLSMFFNGKILHSIPILHSEDVLEGKSGTAGTMSFKSFYLHRFASGAITIIRVDVQNATIISPYFVSASYDQGSSQYPNFLPVDVQTGRFPNILIGRIDPIQQLAIIFSILSALSFGVAFTGTKIKKKYGKISWAG